MSATRSEGTSLPATVAPVCNPWVPVGWCRTCVAWTPGLMVVNLDGGATNRRADQERRLGAEVRSSASEAWPSEVRSFLGPASSLPQDWDQSRGTSASGETVPPQGMREGLSSHPYPSQVLQPGVPRGRSSLATPACQPAVSANRQRSGKTPGSTSTVPVSASGAGASGNSRSTACRHAGDPVPMCSAAVGGPAPSGRF